MKKIGPNTYTIMPTRSSFLSVYNFQIKKKKKEEITEKNYWNIHWFEYFLKYSMGLVNHVMMMMIIILLLLLLTDISEVVVLLLLLEQLLTYSRHNVLQKKKNKKQAKTKSSYSYNVAFNCQFLIELSPSAMHWIRYNAFIFILGGFERVLRKIMFIFSTIVS